MSFCPHCGKSVAEQAVKCIACGGELQPRGKGARFKGTMMMQPGQAPAAPTPPAPAAAPTPAIAKPAPAPAPAPAPEAQRAIAPAPSKAKHTMLGAGGLGGLGLAPPPGVNMNKPTVASVPPGAPPPAAGPSSLPPAAPPSPPAPDPALADTGRNPTPLPSYDPPSYDPPPAAERQASRAHSAPRFDQESDPPSPIPGRKGGPIVALAIAGGMLLLTLLYLVARFLGLA